ncbi:MAG: stage II sporulation protein M [Chloroflexi bacterium]|nr:stage II sporulation protein M [Chloroflexota bacterium]MCL5273911.1 stage II sporulation protein M [Chloroflexota bacterium]
MNAEQFIAANREKWDRLSQLVARSAGSGIRRMQPGELEELGNLYRTATSDFALAQRDYAGQPVVVYLNQLVARAHSAVYRGRPAQRIDLYDFLARRFPRTYRALIPYILAAFLILTVPAVANGILVFMRPDIAEWTFDDSTKELIPLVRQGQLWIDLPEDKRPAASAFIMTNNIRVSLAAFAGGASAGLVTLYILVTNGLSVGGLLGLCFHYGIGWRLLNFIIGHGVVEFSVIFMAGGAGLRMGWAIIHPGAQSRKDALVLATREAMVLAGGCIPLLMIAGSIEGFISPQFNPLYSGIAAIASGALTYAWLLLGGRSQTGAVTESRAL